MVIFERMLWRQSSPPAYHHQGWINGGHTIHPSTKGLVTPIGTTTTSFQNSGSKVAKLKVHTATRCIRGVTGGRGVWVLEGCVLKGPVA